MIFHNPGRVTKMIQRSAIISIHLLNQEVRGYPQKHALILHGQKPFQVRPANSTRHDYLGPVQFDLVDTISTPNEVCCPSLLVSM